MAVDLHRRDAVERARPVSAGGGWGWLAQVVSGGLLLALIGVHLVAQHFVVSGTGGLRDRAQVLDYLGNPLVVVIESAFLVVVTWHAMLGLRSVLFDLGCGEAGRRWIGWALWVLGVLTVAYGGWLLTAIVTAAP